MNHQNIALGLPTSSIEYLVASPALVDHWLIIGWVVGGFVGGFVGWVVGWVVGGRGGRLRQEGF